MLAMGAGCSSPRDVFFAMRSMVPAVLPPRRWMRLRVWSSSDLMGFVVRMWDGASAMLELQGMELGYQIELTGSEIADLAAFASDAGAQRDFSMDEIPIAMRDWLIEKPYWMGEGWPETFEQEYHENGLPLDYD